MEKSILNIKNWVTSYTGILEAAFCIKIFQDRVKDIGDDLKLSIHLPTRVSSSSRRTVSLQDFCQALVRIYIFTKGGE